MSKTIIFTATYADETDMARVSDALHEAAQTSAGCESDEEGHDCLFRIATSRIYIHSEKEYVNVDHEVKKFL